MPRVLKQWVNETGLDPEIFRQQSGGRGHRDELMPKSHLLGINSSLFEFRPLAEALLNIQSWYEEGKVHQALAGLMVRSKSEVIVADTLTRLGISFEYEKKLPLRTTRVTSGSRTSP